MEQKTIELVQTSFKKVVPIKEQAAAIFYEKLFEKDPALKPLFPASDSQAMEGQGYKLMTMLGSAVAGLSNLEGLIPILEDLGKRHLGYKVEPAHYDTVGAALLDTLEVGLGADFTEEVKEAWAGVYTVMADVMKNAAYEKAE